MSRSEAVCSVGFLEEDSAGLIETLGQRRGGRRHGCAEVEGRTTTRNIYLYGGEGHWRWYGERRASLGHGTACQVDDDDTVIHVEDKEGYLSG